MLSGNNVLPFAQTLLMVIFGGKIFFGNKHLTGRKKAWKNNLFVLRFFLTPKSSLGFVPRKLIPDTIVAATAENDFTTPPNIFASYLASKILYPPHIY